MLLKLVANRQAQNHEVVICYLKGKAALSKELAEGIRIKQAQLGPLVMFRIRKLIKEFKPDIVHTHLGHADLITMFAAVGMKGRYFSTMHNIWFKKGLKDYLFFFFYTLFCHTTAKKFRFIAISQSVYTHLRKNFRLPQRRVKVIYNAIDTSRCYNQAITGDIKKPGQFTLLFIGRLTLQKNLPFLLENFSILLKEQPDLRLILLGDGELRQQLENLAAQLGIQEKISFAGYQSDPERYLASADCLVLTSLFEGFGIVILEAFRSGIPVLVPAIEGPKELIKSGYNGLLFESQNSEDFRDKFKQLYLSKELRANMATNGLRELPDFSIDKYIEKLHLYYCDFV